MAFGGRFNVMEIWTASLVTKPYGKNMALLNALSKKIYTAQQLKICHKIRYKQCGIDDIK
jgi:hypothetical protein